MDKEHHVCARRRVGAAVSWVSAQCFPAAPVRRGAGGVRDSGSQVHLAGTSERAAERHCGRATLMCGVGNRARPTADGCQLPSADRKPPHSDVGIGGAAAGFLATTAARRVRTRPTRPLAPTLLRQTRNLTFSWKP